ncbi:MAG TPA: pseudouridine synthase [Dehalococcoidia bacterium]|nr:pseudouridine synthase [Dehalococcoidia bacterium]
MTLLRAVIDTTGLSRRKAFAAIREGRIAVAGEVRTNPSQPHETGALSLDGKPIAISTDAKTYLLLNKPPGFITTKSDDLGRRTVFDLIPAASRVSGLHPVGRLDRDTSGLLLLTNDGDFTFALTHPSHEVEKEYWIRLHAPATEEQLAALRSGIELDGELRRPLRLRRLVANNQFELAITIREGRRRQVRRMFLAVGAEIVLLRRVREGALDLGSLPEGAVRPLTPEEVTSLLPPT